VEIVLAVALVALVVLGLVAFVAIRSRKSAPGIEPAPRHDSTLAIDLDVIDVDQGTVGEAITDDEIDLEDLVIEEFVVRPRLRDRLGRAREAIGDSVRGLRGRSLDDATWDDLEETLLRADVGVRVTTELLDDLRRQAKDDKIVDSEQLLSALKSQLRSSLSGADRTLRLESEGPSVWLFVGVNGVGKTTTIGKLARQQTDAGRSVVLAAADTFRAAAAEQLDMWAQRSGADIVRGSEGGDPGAVVHDAVQRAAARKADLVLADTAGRLHNKANLMDELAKVRRVADRDPGTVTEVLLVLDATTGQNGLNQAKVFGEVTGLTGVVLTKLDGSAKGGVAFAIETEMGVPIKLVGVGEGLGDLISFDPDEFVDALFDES
jgi:fused signal recognition particle receptor